MKAIIEIDMDGAAFEDPANRELERILEGLAKLIERRWHYDVATSQSLYDINGNRCGTFRIVND